MDYFENLSLYSQNKINSFLACHICKSINCDIRRKKYGYSRLDHFNNTVLHKIPNITQDDKDKLRIAFQQCSCAHDDIRGERMSFLPFNFVGYKLCQLLEFNQYLLYVTLPKNMVNIYAYDNRWKKICEIRGWKFISTI